MRFRRGMAALLAAAVGAGPTLAADTPEDWTQPTRKWNRGPVQCLLTEDEEKRFRTLETDEQRAEFIKEFWARRDPTPDTPENEFAQHFWKQVADADRIFPQTTDSGALSDRGQIFLLFGQPTRTPPPGKNLEWVYENVPHMNPSSFTIQFRAVGGGNLLLLGKKEVNELIAQNEWVRGLGPAAKEIFTPPPVEVTRALPSADEAEPPPDAAPTEEQRILDQAASAATLPTDIPLSARTDIYAATRGDSFVTVTLGVPRGQAPEANLVGFARFVPESPDVRPITLAAQDSFAPAEAENAAASSRMLLFQGGTGLHPGRYTLTAGVRDPASGKVGILRQPLEVPAYTESRLALSSVALLRKLERLNSPPPVAEGKKRPFVLGNFRVVPALEPVYPQGADMAWYFQVYNAAKDPASGNPNLTLQYDFLLKQKGEYRPVTAPQVVTNHTTPVVAFSFPLVKPSGQTKGWPVGDYKLKILVTDEIAKSSVSRELDYNIVP